LKIPQAEGIISNGVTLAYVTICSQNFGAKAMDFDFEGTWTSMLLEIQNVIRVNLTPPESIRIHPLQVYTTMDEGHRLLTLDLC